MSESSRFDELPILSHPSRPEKTPPPPDTKLTDPVLSTARTPNPPKAYSSSFPGALDPDIKAEKKDDIHAAVVREVMNAIFHNVAHLLESKFPDGVFNSFLGKGSIARAVLKACPVVVDSHPSSSETEVAAAVVDQPNQTPDTEIESDPSVIPVTTTTNGQVANSTTSGCTSGGDRTTGAISSDNISASHEFAAQLDSSSDQATRPIKSLPRRSARIPPSIAHAQESPEVISPDSAGRRALECPIQKILDGISTAFYDRETKRWKNWPKTNKTGKEQEVAEYLTNVVDAARQFAAEVRKSNSTSDPPTETEVAGKDWVFSAKFANTPLESKGAKRKPDIVVIPREEEGEKRTKSWGDDVRAIGELKKNSTFSLSDLTGTLSEYARLCFGHQRARRFVLGFSLLNTKMRLWKLDRSGVLSSREFDVHENPLDFLRVILGLTTADDYYLGLDPSFIHEDDKDWIMLNDERYEIVRTIHLDSVIRGRGTVALLVKDKHGKYRVMKDQWVDRSRKTKEFEMLEKLKKEEVKKVSRIIDYQIVHFQVGDEVVCDSTENDRNTKELKEKVEKNGVETRDHYRLLISPYGDNLENFRSLKELVSVFKDYVEVIRDLYNAGILHRDISPRNLIIVEEEYESVRKGYVIDFDYAIFISRVGSAEAERTGTLPFMAIDILMNKVSTHGYHHDLESLFYVLLWICITQDGPKSKPRPPFEFNFKNSPLRDWCGARDADAVTLKQAGSSKDYHMIRFKEQILPYLPEYFRPLENLLLSLRSILFQHTETNDIESLPEDQRPISKRTDISGVFRKFVAAFEATLKGLPDEQITRRSETDTGTGCNVDPESDFVAAEIPKLIELRPIDLLPVEVSKPDVGGGQSHAASELHRTAVMNAANNSTGSCGVKRSHDEEQAAEALPPYLSSLSKRVKSSMNDGQY